MAECINIYDHSLARVNEIRVRGSNSASTDSFAIADFAHSEKYLRIGVVTKETSLYFWDSANGYSEQTQFSLIPHTQDQQDKIWFINFLDSWITSDTKCCLNFWNLSSQTLVKKIKIKRSSSSNTGIEKNVKMNKLNLPGKTIALNRSIGVSISEIMSIDHLKLLAVATSDKIISLHETETFLQLSSFSLELGGFNFMHYFESYQLFLVAGFENTVKVFNITPEHYEINCLGRLVGHTSIVTAITPIEGTAMVVSCDDKGYSKIWDIRKMACIQTIQLANKSNIIFITNLSKKDKVVFVGDRINCFEFEHLGEEKGEDKAVAFSCGLNEHTQELFVALRNEIRVLDYSNGKIKAKLVNLMDREREDELTVFKLLPKKNQFVLGDFTGRVCMFNSSNGDLTKRSLPHHSSVTSIFLDHENNLIVSTSLDASVKVQVEKDLIAATLEAKGEPDERTEFFSQPMLFEEDGRLGFLKFKREVLKKNDQMMNSKLHQEIFHPVGDTVDNIAIVRDIEECNKNSEIHMMEVSPYHNILALASMAPVVWLYNYEYIRPVAKIELENNNEVSNLTFINGYGKLVICTVQNQIHIVSLQYESANKLIPTYDLRVNLNIFTCKDMEGTKVPLAGCVNKTALNLTFQKVKDSVDEGDNFKVSSPRRNKSFSLKSTSTDFFLGESSGVVIRLDLDDFLKGETTFDNFCKNPNYNAFRNISENFTRAANTLPTDSLNLSIHTPRKNMDHINPFLVKTFRVARQGLTHLELLRSAQPLLLLASLDSTVRIFSIEGEMVCHLNLNHPLPIMWQVSSNSLVNSRANVIFALKLVELINQRYNIEGVTINLQTILETYSKGDFLTFNMTAVEDETKNKIKEPIVQRVILSSGNNTILPSINKDKRVIKPNESQENMAKQRQESSNLILMKDVYTPKDLAYENIKLNNREEIRGPTLKQMDSIRRAKNIFKLNDPISEIAIDQEIIERSLAEEKKLKMQPILGKAEHPLEDLLRAKDKHKSLASKVEQSLWSIDRGLVNSSSKESDRKVGENRIVSFEKGMNTNQNLNSREIILSSKVGRTVPTLPSATVSHKSTANITLLHENSSIVAHSIHFFDYAVEKNLLLDDGYSAEMSQRSKILNEGNESRISAKQSVIDRKIEQHKFQTIMKEMDRRVAKAKARVPHARLAELEFTNPGSGYGMEIADFSVFSTQPSRLHPSASLPRLKKL